MWRESQQRWRLVGLLLGLLVVHPLLAQAQQSSRHDTCRQPFVNRSGTAGAPITVSTVAVTVVAANQKLCEAIILNRSQADSILCRFSNEGDPTATVGFPVDPGGIFGTEFAMQKGLKCIRAAGSANDVTVYTIEIEP